MTDAGCIKILLCPDGYDPDELRAAATHCRAHLGGMATRLPVEYLSLCAGYCSVTADAYEARSAGRISLALAHERYAERIYRRIQAGWPGLAW